MAITLYDALMSAQKKNPRIEFHDDPNANPKQRWRWTLWMSSDKVAASSEGYSTKQLAIENVKSIEQHIKWLRENSKLI